MPGTFILSLYNVGYAPFLATAYEHAVAKNGAN